MDIYSELKFSKKPSFFDKHLAIRWAIGLSFAFCLSLFLHFRELPVNLLELNSIAPQYVIAQIDFNFLDRQATAILKQEAVREIGRIEAIAEAQIRQRRLELNDDLLYHQEWRKQIDNSSFEKLSQAADLLEKGLLQIRFADAQTIQKMQQLGFPTVGILFFTFPTEEPTLLPEQVWDHMLELLSPGNNFKKEIVDFLLFYFKNKFWTIEEDVLTERAVRQKAEALVGDKYTHVTAGSRLIAQGEKVTPRHMAMLQAMKKALKAEHSLLHPVALLGSLIMAFLLTFVFASYLAICHPQVCNSNRKLLLIALVILLDLACAKGVEYLLLNGSSSFVELSCYPLLVPFAAIVICCLLNPALATCIAVFLTALLAISFPFDNRGFLVANLGAAIVAIIAVRSVRRRKEILAICGKAWLFAAAVIIAMNFYEERLNGKVLVADLLSSLAFMSATALLVWAVLPLLELLFHVMTDATLMEYMDPTHELLRRLSFEAPGTYQHSLVVGNIAESAALAIGANGLFCRISSLYHDIGKMSTPQYFTENQQGGMNIHQLLTPLESANAIMAHISEGIAMARKAGLPEQFIDVIKEHHGTTLVYYFYRRQLDLLKGDKSLIDEKEFRYPGPKPRSKESAIIMIADSLEAASRSLDRIDEESITLLIEKIIREKAEDGQLDECQLTFHELSMIKKSMIKILLAAGHLRIKYPTKEKEKGPVSNSASMKKLDFA